MPRSLLLTATLAGLLSVSAVADPCGMVPPVTTDATAPLVRIGAQKTYVFYKNGIECIALRPGFRGKVEHFGMLIPFPSPPAIRKLPDEVFGHVAASIDPPEAVADFRVLWREMRKSRRRGGKRPGMSGKKLGINQVKVLREEAVGMYQVAVLEAGSAKALSAWMDRHGYRYPAGMDGPVNDYVAERWCFVAVKTKVGRKKDADPRPGMKEADPAMPKGATFDGHVQAMGFRFRTDTLVVPMRLSAFNGGKLRNIVYVLADRGLKIKGMPDAFVRRQLTGEALVENLTRPRPLRILGLSREQFDKSPERWLKQLRVDRDPGKVNGHARHLFAGDLAAAAKGVLIHAHEEAEKELLRVSERLQLRGGKIDGLHLEQADKAREALAKEALTALKAMTMTVIDGDFPREHIAKHNLTFEPYTLPAKDNHRGRYDAIAGEQPGAKNGFRVEKIKQGAVLGGGSPWQLGLLGLLAVALGVGLRRRRGAAVAAVIAALCLAGIASADGTPIPKLIEQLRQPKTSQAALAALIERGQPAVKHLVGEAVESPHMASRGWAIVALGEIGGDAVDARLAEIHDDEKMPQLVRTWAAAARVRNARTTDQLVALAQLVPRLPALGRPIARRLVGLVTTGEAGSAEQLLELGTKVPALQQTLATALLKLGAGPLVQAMVKGKNDQIRRQAAGYLGALARTEHKSVVREVVKAYQFDGKATDVAWKGGALFLPGIQWQKEEARMIVGELIAWHTWVEVNQKGRQNQQQIHNNIRGVGLSRVAGYRAVRNNNSEWLGTWGQCVGQAELRELLDRVGVTQRQPFAGILARAPKK